MAFVKGFIPFDLKRRGEWTETRTQLGDFMQSHGIDIRDVASDSNIEVQVNPDDSGFITYTRFGGGLAPNGSLYRYIYEHHVDKMNLHTFADLKETYFLVTDDNQEEDANV